MEFGNEIGKTLDGVLRRFPNNDLCVDDIIEVYGVKYPVAQELIFALVRRGYIINVDAPYDKKYVNPNDIDLVEKFRITVEGRDYLELHRVFWQRFWFRSIGCPVIVSFITALNAEPIFHLIKSVLRFIYVLR